MVEKTDLTCSLCDHVNTEYFPKAYQLGTFTFHILVCKCGRTYISQYPNSIEWVPCGWSIWDDSAAHLLDSLTVWN